MRIIVYGMQSSGASYFTYFLAQKTNYIGVIDVWSSELAPFFENNNVILKAVITKKYTIEQHIDKFKPDIKILFTRNIDDNYSSLIKKYYCNHDGKIEEKIKILEEIKLKNNTFDYIVDYDDFINNDLNLLKKLNNFCDKSSFLYKRTCEEIKQYNMSNSKWCLEEFGKKWGFGNINWGNIKRHISII